MGMPAAQKCTAGSQRCHAVQIIFPKRGHYPDQVRRSAASTGHPLSPATRAPVGTLFSCALATLNVAGSRVSRQILGPTPGKRGKVRSRAIRPGGAAVSSNLDAQRLGLSRVKRDLEGALL